MQGRQWAGSQGAATCGGYLQQRPLRDLVGQLVDLRERQGAALEVDGRLCRVLRRGLLEDARRVEAILFKLPQVVERLEEARKVANVRCDLQPGARTRTP